MAIHVSLSINNTCNTSIEQFLLLLIEAVIFNRVQEAMQRKVIASIAAAEALEEATATESIIQSLRCQSPSVLP